jgi:hypothetical protein
VAPWDVLLEDRHDMGHRLVANRIDQSDLSFSAKHAEHPSDLNVVAQALEPFVIDLGLVDLNDPRQH